MKRNLKWSMFAIAMCKLLTATDQSIAGVTYRDNFDFVERYRNVNKCNPMHWYPLHMPDYCMKMYEKLIRSKISKLSQVQPTKSVRDRAKVKNNQQVIYKLIQMQQNDDVDDTAQDLDYYAYDDDSSEMPLYQVMLRKISQDARRGPVIPTLGFLPYVGLSTIYRQPVSDGTSDVIQEIAGAYADALKQSYQQTGLFPVPYPQINVECNNETTTTPPEKENKPEPEQVTEKKEIIDNSNSTLKHKRKVSKKTIEIGNFVAYLEHS